MLKENRVIYNEDNIDLEVNNHNIHNTFEVPQEKNMEPRINAQFVYMDFAENLKYSNNLLDDIESKLKNTYEIQTLLEFKLIDNKEQFRKHNFRLLILTVLLTFIEVLYKQFDIVNSSEIISVTTKNVILMIPVFITSLITLLSAWIKNLKFEEVIENISRGIEKLITAKLKLQRMEEDIKIIIKNNNNYNYNKKELDKLIKEKYQNVLDEYLEAHSIADKNFTPTDFSKYLSQYLKTQENEKKLEIGKIKIYKQSNIDSRKIQIKHEKQETYNKLKEYKYRKNEVILNNKLEKLKDKTTEDDNDISHMIENKIYTKIKKFIKYLFDR